MFNFKKKKFIWKISVLLGMFFLFGIFFNCTLTKKDNLNFSGVNKNIILVDDGLVFENISSRADTVGEFLQEQKIIINNDDYLFPAKENRIFSESQIIISRIKNIEIITDGKIEKFYVYGKNIASALWENDIELGEDDFTRPDLNYPVRDGDKIEVIRVSIREEVIKKDIPFPIKENEDDKLSWRTRKVTQKGEKGIRETTYKVIFHNNKEISRRIINEVVTKEPVPEIVTQGTYMKLGKAKEGQATWYYFKGGMFAASTTLPYGTYAKVTNIDNGKSVVVRINDYGPFGKGRIIDLDKPAFQKISSLGVGVINVKVEQILN